MIEICEVGPRDGLQNESKLISTETKVELITKLIDAGIRNMEAVSFVNPKVVPQMADAEEVMKLVPKRDDVRYGGLALSASGLERALNTSVDFVHVVTTTSDTFNLRNAKRTVDQALNELSEVIHKGVAANKGMLAALGTSFGCPFEGEVPLSRVLHVTETFLKAGCTEITLADTTGMANPTQVQHVVEECYKQFGNDLTLGLHFHNTRGLGLANILAGYQAGVKKFDTSIAGLGGCPFAPKAVGNACTEDMVNMFHGMGVDTGTDLSKLLETAKWMEDVMERRLDGMLMKVG
ncbi:hydroxymethylglutaryl-CoA lyase [Sutcliffiella rhizosphaerae]|uniref:Hydroxymethylglutaryl-CoA lyase YngG n=1 Tax=Sutcliffiella rhizosphaerae TaxID=2880967 RepID=A0ABN8AC25_9BACI|nr:hydroxymethylglutaryl-CoA lyase [Sutcliffiella rhizosphaerae]CAG9621222.1 Hydroxymethylglutaryl-CoA lyase YngG [Sutcliffiella rhizosphaerae]